MLTEDLDQVMEIETDLFAMPWTKEGMFTFLTREDTMFFVVEEKNRILGYCSMQTVLDEGDILNVAVCRDRQKEGIGYFLVNSMLMLAECIRESIWFISKYGRAMEVPADSIRDWVFWRMDFAKIIILTRRKMRFL